MMHKKMLILLGIFLVIGMGTTKAYSTNGNTIFINDTKALITSTPATMYFSGYNYLNVTSKIFTGNVNILFGFNTTNVQPLSYELQQGNNWTSIANMFNKTNYNYDGKNLWYYASNVPITAGQTYATRMYLNITQGESGKYDFAIYPSSYGTNIAQAITDGNLFLLDPFYNASYTYCVNVTASAAAFVPRIPLTPTQMINMSDGTLMNIQSGSCNNPSGIPENYMLGMWDNITNGGLIYLNDSTNTTWAIMYQNNTAVTRYENGSAAFGTNRVQTFNEATNNTTPTGWSAGTTALTATGWDGEYASITGALVGSNNIGILNVPLHYAFFISFASVSSESSLWLSPIDLTHEFVFGVSANGSSYCDGSARGFGKVLSAGTKYWVEINVTGSNNGYFYINGAPMSANDCKSGATGGDLRGNANPNTTSTGNPTNGFSLDNLIIYNNTATPATYTIGTPTIQASTITITYPQNTTYLTWPTTINITVLPNSTVTTDKCWMIDAKGTRTNISNCINGTFTASAGANTITAYANFSDSSQASKTLNFITATSLNLTFDTNTSVTITWPDSSVTSYGNVTNVTTYINTYSTGQITVTIGKQTIYLRDDGASNIQENITIQTGSTDINPSSGYVWSNIGQVAGANVKIYLATNGSYKLYQSVITGSDGSFTLNMISGTYLYTVNQTGYIYFSQTKTITSAQMFLYLTSITAGTNQAFIGSNCPLTAIVDTTCQVMVGTTGNGNIVQFQYDQNYTNTTTNTFTNVGPSGTSPVNVTINPSAQFPVWNLQLTVDGTIIGNLTFNYENLTSRPVQITNPSTSPSKQDMPFFVLISLLVAGSVAYASNKFMEGSAIYVFAIVLGIFTVTTQLFWVPIGVAGMMLTIDIAKRVIG